MKVEVLMLNKKELVSLGGAEFIEPTDQYSF